MNRFGARWRRLLRMFGPSPAATAPATAPATTPHRPRCPRCGRVVADACLGSHDGRDESTVEENGWPLPW